MTMAFWGTAALLAHLVLAAVFIVLVLTRVLAVKPYVIPVIVFVPLWG